MCDMTLLLPDNFSCVIFFGVNYHKFYTFVHLLHMMCTVTSVMDFSNKYGNILTCKFKHSASKPALCSSPIVLV